MNPPGRRRLVPAYLATGGSARASRNTLDRLTVLSSTGSVPEGLAPPGQRVAQLLHGGALTLAEVAAYTRLPVSVAKVVVSDLVDRGFVVVHASMLRSASTKGAKDAKRERENKELLERVLHGLHAKL